MTVSWAGGRDSEIYQMVHLFPSTSISLGLDAIT